MADQEITWNNLHADIQHGVAIRLRSLKDLCVCSAVSKSWNSACAPIVKSPPPLLLRAPMLIYANQTDAEKKENSDSTNKKKRRDCGGRGRRLFSLLHGGTCSFESAAEEMIRGRWCFGTLNGWLLTSVPGSDANLIHLFARSKIDLPSLSRCKLNLVGDDVEDDFPYRPKDRFIRKAVLTDSPWLDGGGGINPNCVVVALVGFQCGVWSCKLAASSKENATVAGEWAEIDPKRTYFDIVYHKGNIYATGGVGDVYQIHNYNAEDGAFSCQYGEMVYDGSGLSRFATRYYLVSSISEDLLIVGRHHGGEYWSSDDDVVDKSVPENLYVTIGFTVRRLVEEEEEEKGCRRRRYKCETVHNLREDEALFIGQCSSTSVSVAVGGMLRPNCIYFTDDDWQFFSPVGGGHDVGVFNLTDATITSYYDYVGGKECLSFSCPPLWYI